MAAFETAVSQGAPAIEVDVVPTADGGLLLRHDAQMSLTTDVASRPEFADRRRVKTIAGRRHRGWFAEDFTLAEACTLRARERYPATRVSSAACDGTESLIPLPELLAFVAAHGVRLVIELKHADRAEAAGLPLDELVLRDLGSAPDADVVVESFEHEVLDALALRGFDRPLVALIGDAPIGDRKVLADPAALDRFMGVSLRLGLARPERVGMFRERGREVWTWTLRPENRFLPRRFRRPDAVFGDYAEYWRKFARAGVTGVFADHPDLALAAFS